MSELLTHDQHLAALLHYLETSEGLFLVRYAPNHIILASNRVFLQQAGTNTSPIGESINRYLVGPDGADCSLLSTEPADLPVAFTAKLRANDATLHCRLYATPDGYLLLGECLAMEQSAAIDRMSLMTNELAELTLELRKRNAALEQANETIRELTRVDPLTGLANRRRFAEVLDIDMARARRHQEALSLITLDLDRFKLVNDTYGHDVGDQVLRDVAMVLKESCRTEDLAVRLGGEEFLLLAPNTVVDEAYTLAERLRVAIAAAPVLPKGGHITVSFGVTQLLPQDNYFSFMKRADMALYEAKSGGRNKTVVRMTNDPKH